MVFRLAIGFFLGLGLFYSGFNSLRRKRKIEHTPTSKIRSLSLGEVEIYGEALPNNSPDKAHNEKDCISPFTKKKCVYYSASIEEYRSSGKSGRWVQIHGKGFLHPFYIKDDTGKVLVDPKGAEINVPVDFREESGFGRDPSRQVQDYLKECDINFEGFFGMNKKMRYTESIIAVQDKVYVFGDAMPSGKMSSVGCENIVINKNSKRSFFFISDRHEKDILKLFGKKVLFKIYGGALLSIVCLAIFLAAF